MQQRGEKLRIFVRMVFYLSFSTLTLPATVNNNWLIIPGVRVGPITDQTSECDLKKLFGPENVRDGEVPMAEGMSDPGTIVFPDNPEKRLYIIWKDLTTKTSPESIIVCGRKSIWKTSEGITLGLTLKDIEKINGKPFFLTGFLWDYEGGIRGSNGGVLKELGEYQGESTDYSDRTLFLCLSPDYRKFDYFKELESIMGDRVFLSNHPQTQMLNPYLSRIGVGFLPHRLLT